MLYCALVNIETIGVFIMKKVLLTAVILFSVLITGCSDSNNNGFDYLTFVQDNFQTNESVNYTEPLLSLASDHHFEFEISQVAFDAILAKGYLVDDIFSLYFDADLTIRFTDIQTSFSTEDGLFIVAPAHTYFFTPTGMFRNTDDWGHFSHYHLVQNFDLTTGVRLEIPYVTVFTVERELDRPVVSVEQEENGSFTFAWNEIEGAEYYSIVRVRFCEDVGVEMVTVTTTTELMWNTELDGYEIDDVVAAIFAEYYLSRDQQIINANRNALEHAFWWDTVGINTIGSTFGVMAHSQYYDSNLSFHHESEFNRSEMICAIATFALREVKPSLTINNIADIPAFLPVTTCDGDTINVPVIIDIDNMDWQEGSPFHVYYRLSNSAFRNYFIIQHPPGANFLADLESQQEIMDAEFMRIGLHQYQYDNRRVVAFDVRKSNVLPNVTDLIFANNELEYFIAANIMDGAGIIDISEFSDRYQISRDLILAILEQTRYQMPLTLRFFFDFDSANNLVLIHRLHNEETVREIQQMIRDEVSRVVSEIITEDMSDAQKVFAINHFIIENTTGENMSDCCQQGPFSGEGLSENFIHGQPIFVQRQAAVTTLLLDYIGIPNVIIAGIFSLTRDYYHNWNRVQIGEQWYNVDVWFNGTNPPSNSLLLVCDELAGITNREGTNHLVDQRFGGLLGTLTAPNPSVYEYHRYHGAAANTRQEAINILTRALRSSDSAMVRIPHSFTNNDEIHIGQSVANNVGDVYLIPFNGILTIGFHYE